MPPRGGLPISDADVDALVHYLRSLSELEPQTAQAKQGRAIYMRGCLPVMACKLKAIFTLVRLI